MFQAHIDTHLFWSLCFRLQSRKKKISLQKKTLHKVHIQRTIALQRNVWESDIIYSRRLLKSPLRNCHLDKLGSKFKDFYVVRSPIMRLSQPFKRAGVNDSLFSLWNTAGKMVMPLLIWITLTKFLFWLKKLLFQLLIMPFAAFTVDTLVAHILLWFFLL